MAAESQPGRSAIWFFQRSAMSFQRRSTFSSAEALRRARRATSARSRTSRCEASRPATSTADADSLGVLASRSNVVGSPGMSIVLQKELYVIAAKKVVGSAPAVGEIEVVAIKSE